VAVGRRESQNKPSSEVSLIRKAKDSLRFASAHASAGAAVTKSRCPHGNARTSPRSPAMTGSPDPSRVINAPPIVAVNFVKASRCLYSGNRFLASSIAFGFYHSGLSLEFLVAWRRRLVLGLGDRPVVDHREANLIRVISQFRKRGRAIEEPTLECGYDKTQFSNRYSMSRPLKLEVSAWTC
jgi:hypothetical protein